MALRSCSGKPGDRQAAMYALALNVFPARADPFRAFGRATYADLFGMFEAPFRSGHAWGRKEDEGRDNVVVLSAMLADRLFPDHDAVGHTVNLGQRDYRVVGVLRTWIVQPHFYDLNPGSFGETEDFYVPFTTAIERQLQPQFSCSAPAPRRRSRRT